MKNFCIVVNYTKDGSRELADELLIYIKSKGGVCNILPKDANNQVIASSAPEDTECCIVIGGDGTLLQSARAFSMRDVYMLGINMGSLGFLTTVEAADAKKAVDKLMADEFTVDERMAASIKMDGRDEEMALNDIVISRGGYSHLVGIKIYVNDTFFGAYEGDGLIISTPTGSTGYNLSAGGPIVTTNVDAMLITPICAHALNGRSFVVSGSDVVRVRMEGVRHESVDNAYITVDGEEYAEIKDGEEFIVSKSDKKCKMAVVSNKCFMDNLATKLK